MLQEAYVPGSTWEVPHSSPAQELVCANSHTASEAKGTSAEWKWVDTGGNGVYASAEGAVYFPAPGDKCSFESKPPKA